ncbi:hypothetical protein ABFS82_06G145600 [Erythranthe guttata]|uniref:C2 domain-containing protein n=1 Tax=Erythranthe guttata TaxID=4155 RepID=A0A022QX31_ERYGU|nr:hypothetical protein MIMGU_mgv1a021668mg [Erythranthe guttata]
MTVGTMEVTLFGGKGLLSTHLFGRIDPYVVIQYGNEEHISKIAHGQGSKPEWNERFKFKVHYPADAGDDNQRKYKLFLQIMDHDRFTRDDYLGQTTIYVKELLELGVENGKAELGTQKYRVVLKDGTYYGEIRVGISFSTATGGDDED